MKFPTIEPLEARIAPASLSIADVKITEGNSGTKMAAITATLDVAATSDVTFTLSTQNGTAVAGSDYVAATQAVTIPTGQKTATFNVAINGDTTFEATESFFVNLTNASSNVTVVNSNHVNPAAQATARVYIYNDDTFSSGRTAKWIDVDGDLVTMTVSKGSLPLGNSTLFTFDTTTSTVGGRILQVLDLATFRTTFAGTNVSITATKQPGFPGTSDGRVDVGFIRAASFIYSELQVIGMDLGVVTIDGDLAQISAGDQFATPAIAKLDVYSLGVKTSTLPPAASGADPTVLRTESTVLGPVGTLNVKTDVAGYFHVVGAEFGTIGTVKVGGDLKGGALANSGRITASGRIANATIGNIVGGAGNISGVLSGTAETGGRLGNVTILGDVTGGAGANSGEIFSAATIGAINIAGKITGSSGDDSGSVQSTGSVTSLTVGTIAGGTGVGSGSVRVGVDDANNAIGVTANLGAVKITGKDASNDSLKGNTGVNSGRIDVLGSILNFSAAGDLQGGTGKGSGELINRSTIGAIKIDGKLTGAGGEDSGSIQSGGNVTSLIIGGLVSGGTGLGSGSIRVGVSNTGAATGTGANIGAVTFGATGATGDILMGGTGVNSGQLDVATHIASITANGNVHGAAANGSGAIIAGGNINKLIITGSLLGADSAATALNTSGAIKASWLKSVAITGDIVAGKKGGAGTITSSGAILADRIDVVTIGGKLTGDATNPVFINATGLLGDLAIRSLTVNGVVNFAEIRAGYDAAGARSADAAIGTIVFGPNSTVHALDIVAGTKAGTDNVFGTNDDVVVSGSVKNDPAILSKIASVIFKNANAIVTNTTGYGISAQYVAAVTLGTTPISLLAGPGNDRTPTGAPVEIGGATNFRVVEAVTP